jgi:hypothetical protein
MMTRGTYQRAKKPTTTTCAHCGEVFAWKLYGTGRGAHYNRAQRFCSVKCANDAQIKPEGCIDQHGYRFTYRSDGAGGRKWKTEHREIMAKELGRDLYPHETVHHKNGDRQDNRLDNLELFSSRHPPGQRVVDKVAFALSILQEYPDIAADMGYSLAIAPTGPAGLSNEFSHSDAIQGVMSLN